MSDRQISDIHPSISRLIAQTRALVRTYARYEYCPDTFLSRRHEFRRPDLKQKQRQAAVAANVNAWINSPGLRPPAK
jgi:hypothetical protein